jgi:hypothetical protein
LFCLTVLFFLATPFLTFNRLFYGYMDDLAEKLKQRALSMKQYEKMTEEQEEGEWIPPPSDSLKKDKDSKVELHSLLSYSVALFRSY